MVQSASFFVNVILNLFYYKLDTKLVLGTFFEFRSWSIYYAKTMFVSAAERKNKERKTESEQSDNLHNLQRSLPHHGMDT